MNNRFYRVLAAGIISSCAAGISLSASAGTSILPSDAFNSCPLDKAEMQNWFAGKEITLNGKVMPANSTLFPEQNTNCDFFKWSAQMFLWLTSPAKLKSTGDMTYVFDADGFYDISPENDKGVRSFLKNDSPINNFLIRVNKQDQDVPTTIGETGQAGGGGILISQAGSLVYYGIHTNTFYGAFLTGQKAGKINLGTFPTTEADKQEVVDYAKANGLDDSAPMALAMELKTSWVDASTVANPESYVQVKAEVPKYDTSVPTQWTLDGSETKTLALTGMHVVGSVLGHPEMIWATFEHNNNTPNKTFYYQSGANQVTETKFDESATGFTFYAPNTPNNGLNVETAHIDKFGNIVLTSPATRIVPTSVVRTNPWGSAGSDVNSAVVNAQIISMNNNVLGNLIAGDVRRNYVQIGSVWTQTGIIPQSPTPDQTNSSVALLAPEVGSSRLANTTMETYFQGAELGNCFLCHNAGGSPAPEASFGDEELSHIYFDLAPLK
ncbi:MAG: hypothetical protein RIG26_12005 [Thalassospira sp.]|uniref:hypothetical protein n=1 Tax=Thalassospira sp. TaxID=1912094 RepID=UPI0032F08E19